MEEAKLLDYAKLRALACHMVEAVLREVDPEGLLRMGAPSDEYASEAKTIAEALVRGHAVTPDYVRDVWLVSFAQGEMPDGTTYVGKMAMHADFATIAWRVTAGYAGLVGESTAERSAEHVAASALPGFSRACSKCGKRMTLVMWDRPGGAPGNGLRCLSCNPLPPKESSDG